MDMFDTLCPCLSACTACAYGHDGATDAARVQSTRALGGDGDGGGFRNARERASAQKATVSEPLFDECAMTR